MSGQPIPVRVARGFLGRARGLLFSPVMPRGTGLLLPRTRAVHGWLMNRPLDVVFLGPCRRVVGIARLRPGSWHRHPDADAVLELEIGDAAALGIEPGSTVRLVDVGASPDRARKRGRPQPPLEAVPARAAVPPRAAGPGSIKSGSVRVALAIGTVVWGLGSHAALAMNDASSISGRPSPVERAAVADIDTARIEPARPTRRFVGADIDRPTTSSSRPSSTPGPAPVPTPASGSDPGLRSRSNPGPAVLSSGGRASPMMASTADSRRPPDRLSDARPTVSRPTLPEAWVTRFAERAEGLYRQGADAEAIAAFMTWLDADPRAEAIVILRVGNIHQRNGRDWLAIDSYRRALDVDPGARADAIDARRKALLNLEGLLEAVTDQVADVVARTGASIPGTHGPTSSSRPGVAAPAFGAPARPTSARRVDATGVEATRGHSARVDSARVDAARVDAARVDAARVDASKPVNPGSGLPVVEYLGRR